MMRGQRKPPAGDFTERLAKAVARYVTAEPEDKHVVRIAKRYGISHTTLRKTLRETGILAPAKRRQIDAHIEEGRKILAEEGE